MKVKVYPTIRLAGALKQMQCSSGPYLLEELGDRREAARLAEARRQPVNLEPIVVDLGARGMGRRWPDAEDALAREPVTEADSLAARALWALGFRRKVARRRAAAGDLIARLEAA